ncbi:MAG: copper chaperone PCu(A)C [Pseudomonadota bacterium]
MRAAMAAIALLVAACSGESAAPFVVANIEVTEPMPGRGMSAGYMTLTNNTGSQITVTDVRSAEYNNVEIHRSTVEDGVARMRRVDKLEIPAGSTITLERGGLHLMLMQAEGNPDAVSLSFYDGEMLLMNVVANIVRRAD